MATGTTTVDFGAFPGVSDASVAVASASIGAGSLVEAYLFPAATADHSADEHFVDGPIVMAGSIVAGVGFTIYARAGYVAPVTLPIARPGPGWALTDNRPLVYGLWTVHWVHT